MSKVYEYVTNAKKGLSRHEGGFFEKMPHLPYKNPSPR
jgi:hypothetical protein